MKVLNDILGYKNLQIYQDLDFFCFSLDSVILGNYATLRLKDKHICDLGTGNGVIPLILSKRTKSPIIGVEIQEKLANMAIESVKLNKLESQIEIIKSDISDTEKFNYNEYFDLVLCNPPYFKLNEGSYLNDTEEKRIARHEVYMDLNKLFSVSKRILKNNGNLAIVHRPDRILEILNLMKDYNIQPKRIKFIFDKVNKDSKLVLIEGQKMGKEGLKVESPLILYNNNGTMTEEYFSLVNEVRK